MALIDTAILHASLEILGGVVAPSGNTGADRSESQWDFFTARNELEHDWQETANFR